MSDARTVLRQGRDKQRIPFLRASVRVQRAQEPVVPVRLEAVGQGDDRILLAAWRERTREGWRDRWFRLDAVAREMTGYWEERGLQVLPWDLERPFQDTSVLVRDMLLLPLAELEVTRDEMTPIDGEQYRAIDLRPRLTPGGGAPALREICVRDDEPDSHHALERRICEFAADRRTVTRKIDFADWRKEAGWWLAHTRRHLARDGTGAVVETTVTFTGVKVLDEVPDDAFALHPPRSGLSIR